MNEYIISGFSDEIDPNLEKQMEVLKSLGVNHIEIRGVDGKNIASCSLEEVGAIKKRLDAQGFKISAIGSPIGKIQITDDFEPHFELFKHVVEIAKILDTKYIRMFSFFLPADENPADYQEEVFRRMKAFVDYAKSADIVLLHENEKEIYGDIASRCLELMEAFFGDHFKGIFDFANFIQSGQETMSAYEVLKPYMVYIHIKDATTSNGEVKPAGEGDGKVEAILTDLFKNGYEGVLSVEPHLYEFHGLAELENSEAPPPRFTDPIEAYKTAHFALIEILERINL